MNHSDAKRFAYAAYKSAGSRLAAIELLDQVVIGNYQEAADGGGKIMMAATATNKSFSFQFPAGYGPKEIGEMAFNAIRLLNALTDENVATALLRFPANVAVVRYPTAGYGTR